MLNVSFVLTSSIARISKLKEDRARAKAKLRNWSLQRPTKTPLYLLKEREFAQHEEEMEKQKREEELENRKDLFKRISISEIRKHARMHDETIATMSHEGCKSPFFGFNFVSY